MTDAAGSVHGFPAALTSFVGRANVVDEIADHLSQYRLVTVTGPGGAGKTRLAGEVARQVAGRFADGVWLAELAPRCGTRRRWRPLVAAALGIRELPLGGGGRGARCARGRPRGSCCSCSITAST